MVINVGNKDNEILKNTHFSLKSIFIFCRYYKVVQRVVTDNEYIYYLVEEEKKLPEFSLCFGGY